jgi:FkbM family methyltransferase
VEQRLEIGMLGLIGKNVRYYVEKWVFQRYVEEWLYQRDNRDFTRRCNLVNRVWWKFPIRIGWDESQEQMYVEDGGGRLYFCRKSRVKRYRRGIEGCLTWLAEQYMLPSISFREGDYVIDCGSNVGEIGLWLNRAQRGVRVISVEPAAQEADCNDLNVHSGRHETIRKGLWRDEQTLTFYQKGETADSSLFEMEGYTSTVSITTTTIESLVDLYAIPRIRLLKLEAEGAEPEILAGCGRHLDKIDYIAADCGPERGLKQEETATPVINFMLCNNFELVSMKFDRVVCLFRNRNASR